MGVGARTLLGAPLATSQHHLSAHESDSSPLRGTGHTSSYSVCAPFRGTWRTGPTDPIFLSSEKPLSTPKCGFWCRLQTQVVRLSCSIGSLGATSGHLLETRLGAKGIATRNKDATRSFFSRFVLTSEVPVPLRQGRAGRRTSDAKAGGAEEPHWADGED